MVIREITSKDFLGTERQYKLYFNMTEAEIMEFEFGRVKGGISEAYDRMLRAKDTPAVIQAMREVILTAYGVVSEDGEKFQKSAALSEEFTYTQAYSDFMMKLYTDQAYGHDFLNELFPEKTMKKILAEVEENNKKFEEQKQATVSQFPGQQNQTSNTPVNTGIGTPVNTTPVQ